MILGIFGGTGFIGNTFLNKYHLCFDEVILFSNQNSVRYSNVKIVKIESSEFEREFSKCNLIVNAMFDHKYSKNISLLIEILTLCNVYKIKKYIHISTISVYNLKLNLTINDNYSTSKSPYITEKIKQESIILNDCNSLTLKVILQPSIVYGENGGWFQFANLACNSGCFYLPNSGENFCNVVSVGSVCDVIFEKLFDKFSGKSIIGGRNMSWKEFYSNHSKKYFGRSIIIYSTKSKRKYSDNVFGNIFFTLWSSTILGVFFNRMNKYRLGLQKGKNTDEINYPKDLTPVFQNRVLHSNSFSI